MQSCEEFWINTISARKRVKEKELYGLIFSPFFIEEDKIADCASSDTQPIHERT